MLDRQECCSVFHHLQKDKQRKQRHSLKLGKKRRESSKRTYYIISQRVIIKAIIIIHRPHMTSIFRELLMVGSVFFMAGENTLGASEVEERLERGASCDFIATCRAFLGGSIPLLLDCISGGGAEAFWGFEVEPAVASDTIALECAMGCKPPKMLRDGPVSSTLFLRLFAAISTESNILLIVLQNDCLLPLL